MEFKEYRLGDIIKEIIDYRGKTPKKLGGNWAKSGIKAISAKNIKTGKIVQPETIRFVDEKLYKKWMKQEVEKGTVLITSEAPFGETFYWDTEEKIVLSQRIFGLKIKQEYNSKFIYYYMSTKKFQDELRARATGSTVIGLRQPELLKCKIIIPDREVQDKMVEILNTLDKKIELNNQIEDNLYEEGNELLKNDFILENKKENLSQIIKFVKGKKPNYISTNKQAGYEKYLTIACLKGQELKYADKNNMVMSNNDLLMVMDGASSGEVYYGGQGIVGSTLSRIDCIDNNYISEFIFFSLKYYKDLIQSKNTGSAIPHADKVFIGSLEIPRLDIEKQEKYKVLLSKIQHNQNENKILENLRDTLLPKLINGKIDLDKIKI